ncbi:uncharacterized protein SRS1_15489 [Sporisorium reilianum f. sp. reilianum]|uniref:Trafficking protein particle complex subunit 12 n=1 Tax=Sporisorium reilianum f. sp. reilianum TaxID=72559 RepID=A0A2N8UJL2_9BASI|nr:uncharacterized protein SRS1_15489 [Sporisorium reilianum f. sp. reilianum]
MDDTQPSSGSVTFDLLAVAPAFARTASSHAPPQTEQQQELQASSSDAPSRLRLSVPALGDPSLMGELPTTDPLSILLQKHLPPHVRPPRDLSGIWHTSNASASSDVTAPSNEIPDPFVTGNESAAAPEAINADTVRHAAAANSWRKIASLARTKLESYSRAEQLSLQLVDAPATPGEGTMDVRTALEWWSVRLYALARLKLYSMLRTELAALWQVLSTTAAEGGVLADTEAVPFTLRVLKATEPKYRGDVRTAVEQYTLLVHMCKRHMRRLRAASATGDVEGEMRKWRSRAERVGLMLAFTLAEAKDYAGAIEVVTPLIESALRHTEGDSNTDERMQLVVVASRIFIQAGDLPTASSLLDRASAPHPSHPSTSAHLAHARALIHAISADLPAATSLLSTATTPAHRLNAAITTFYAAHLDDALAQLEQLLDAHPRSVASADAVVFNLATLYELGHGSEGRVVERKREVLDRVARAAGEPGVSGSSFKL